MRVTHILLCLTVLFAGIALAVATEAMAADELEIFAGQDKTVRVSVGLEFNDARIVKPDPLDPEKTYTFSWDFDNKKDGNLDLDFTNDGDSTSQFTEWTYHIPGVFIVTLTVSDGGMTVKDTLQVTVKENQAPDVIANDTESAFKEEDHIFFADATDDHHQQHLLRWHWEFGDGTSSDEAPPVIHRFMAVRVYSVKVRVTDPDNAASEHTILVDVREKPGLIGKKFPVEGGKLTQKGTQIREEGWVVYKIPAQNRHEIEVRVTASETTSPPVAVLVFENENAYLDYELGVGGTWVGELSNEEVDYNHKITWEADANRDYYIVIDNGYQMGGGFGIVDGMATVDVTVEDKDRNSFFVDIPLIVWIIILIIVGLIVAFQVVMRLMEVQSQKKQEVAAIHATMAGRDTAVGNLQRFLASPEESTVRESNRARAVPRGPPRPGPGPGMPPGAAPGPGGPPGAAPRPGGPPGRPMPTPGAPGAPQPPPRPQPPVKPPEEPPEAPDSVETPETPEAIPAPEAPVVEATQPKDFGTPEVVEGGGPVYLATEQPKRVSGFGRQDIPDEVELQADHLELQSDEDSGESESESADEDKEE
jgi:PKD repeat protein